MITILFVGQPSDGMDSPLRVSLTVSTALAAILIVGSLLVSLPGAVEQSEASPNIPEWLFEPPEPPSISSLPSAPWWVPASGGGTGWDVFRDCPLGRLVSSFGGVKCEPIPEIPVPEPPPPEPIDHDDSDPGTTGNPAPGDGSGVGGGTDADPGGG
jgi:hypothetical protein